VSRPIHLAFLWHMHQPSYRDPATGEIALPWVRLHATRAYYDMAWMLDRHPDMRATFNFVPVLVAQLEAYLAGERDRYWTLTQRPAESLDASERRFLLKHFFSVSQETEIRPRPRYWSLLARREADPEGNRWTAQDLRDLQALFNLAWFGFAARETYPELVALERKGRDYTERDKQQLLDLQIKVIERTLPLYAALRARGQIELTTTPYYHPILPMLIDTEHAARCQPDKPRPARFAWPEDAEAQVHRAVEAHTRTFGAAPVGAWPAEGSVSPEAVGLFAQHGIQWLASDEAQLFGSIESASRDALYAPYRVKGHGGAVNFVFRDRALSDLMGFTYARNTAEVAVDDLLQRIRSVRSPHPEDPALVLVALDGENPWEYYPNSGRPFLEVLYRRLSEADDIQTVHIAEHIAAHPPRETIEHLHSGSWINGDFGIWLGGSMENRAWELLGQTRRTFETHRRHHAADAVARAYEHILQAEGSDWFWWYGEPFHSQNDADFDELFRGHLAQVYRLFSLPVPGEIQRSLYPPVAHAAASPPTALLGVQFQRPATWFDWLGAGRVNLSGPNSSMYRAASYFEQLRYGFSLDQLFVRLEAQAQNPPELAGLILTVEVEGPAGQQATATIPLDGTGAPHLHAPAAKTLAQLNVRQAGPQLEFGLPFSAVGAYEGDRVTVSLVLREGSVEVDRMPSGRALVMEVPGPAFEANHWVA
jgi:alpha-amylase/alpha-mannosidase (GH57 family)